jgi:uncharacterized protein YlxP (DUF503 family)
MPHLHEAKLDLHRFSASTLTFADVFLMPIASMTIDLRIAHAQSLKDRRQVVRSLKEKLAHGFNISIAEMDEAVTWQSATIGIVAISASRDYLTGQMEQVEKAVARICNDLGAEIVDAWWEFLEP